jgi:hypothetical protein
MYKNLLFNLNDCCHFVFKNHGPVDVLVATLVQLEVGGHGGGEAGNVVRLDHHLDFAFSHLE